MEFYRYPVVVMTQTPLSLLERLQNNSDGVAWSQLVKTYSPLIRAYLQRNRVPAGDLDDLVQDVLHAMVKELPGFRHNQRTGAFRAWLRQIADNRASNYWRSRARSPAAGTQAARDALAQLEDPANDIHRLWDQEHDRFVVQRLLDLIQPEFEPKTWQAFRRTVCNDEKPTKVASDLEISVNAVFIAKSRVLSRLRQEGRGMIA